MLPGATLEQKIATGFNRNHVLTTEGGIFEDEYRVEYVADRVAHHRVLQGELPSHPQLELRRFDRGRLTSERPGRGKDHRQHQRLSRQFHDARPPCGLALAWRLRARNRKRSFICLAEF
jgi:hypothetical protein